MYTEAPTAAGPNIQRMAAAIPKTIFSMTQQTAVTKPGLLDFHTCITALSLGKLSFKRAAHFLGEGCLSGKTNLKLYNLKH